MPADTARRRGSIVQRKDGRWCASVMVDRERTYFYGHSKDEVAAAMDSFLQGGLPTYDQLLNQNRQLRRTVDQLRAEVQALRS